MSLRAAWSMLAWGALMPPFALAAPPAATLVPGTQLEARLDAESLTQYSVSLPEGTAAELELTQRDGLVDLELQDGTAAAVDVRTEAGVDGHIDAPLVASEPGRWTVIVATRKGKGGATFKLRVSDPHPATPTDALKKSAFEHYVEAEQLRRANYRETVVTRRSADIEERTRAGYSAAEAQYAAAGDGCGQRRVRIGLSRMEVALGNLAGARSAAETALTAGCEGDVAERAQALKTLGMAAAYQADFTASAAAAEQALALYRQTGDQRYQGIVLGNLSAVYMELGATDRALAAADGALRAAEATADGQGIVFSRKSIAAIHLARGELAGALEDYRRTLASLAATPYPMIEGETWNDLGIVYHRMADYRESVKAFALARSVWKKMSNRVGEADTLINEAETLLELADSRRAAVDLRRALAIARADGLKSAETRALRGLGSANLVLGRIGAARRYFTQSLQLARATGEITAESYALRGIGTVDFRQGRPAEARRNDQSALDLARQAADRDGQAATLAQLARDVAAGGDLEAARKDIEAALAIIEMQRGQINDPSLRTSYFSSMRAYPDAEIDILMRLDRRFPGKGYAHAALASAERARARSLLDVFAGRSIELSRLAPELADAERSAAERLSTAAFQLGRLRADANADRRQSLTDAFDAASRALDEVRGRVRSADPRYADLVQPAALNVNVVQRALLAEDSAILEYWLGSRESYVWILRRDSFRVVRLPRRANIERRAGDLAALLRAPGRDAPGEGFEGLAAAESRQTEAIDRAAADLAVTLIGADVLRGLPRKIAIVADGRLLELPFGVLPDQLNGRRLGATHDLSYLPSITTLKWLRHPVQDGTRPESLAVFAAPVLQQSAIPTHAAAQTPAPLPYSRVEAEAISAFLPKERVWLALGADASRDNALAADWRRYTIVHFATHAVVDLRRPELSGIVLSLYDPDGHPLDGLLRMNDIYNLDMPVDLVVLSGCETASGRAMDSEGVFSLSRAFFYAGARRVVASLWPVEDRATASFMREFYRGLLVEHMHAGTALRLAQQSISGDKRWSSPYYWGGFVIQGDSD